jgi:hypothetical protein
MRRTIATLLAVCLSTLGAIAQDYPVSSGGSRPQIAYRMLTTWVDGYERDAGQGKKVATSILYSMGGVGVAAAGATYLWGDDISRQVMGKPLSSDARQGIILGAGLGGAALIAAGLIVDAVPIEDKRAVYADIFEEHDAEVQEAMAVSVLRDQAQRGKERRIASFLSSLIVPLVTGGIRVGVNLALGEPWAKDVTKNVGYSSWSAASGILALFSKSKEELLYERYLTARDSLYGRPISAP